MADHFELGESRFVTASDARAALVAHYEGTRKDPVTIARLNDAIRHNMAAARLHFEAAQVQATNDLRASVDQLFQALTAEPDPHGPRRVGDRAPLVVLPERAE